MNLNSILRKWNSFFSTVDIKSITIPFLLPFMYMYIPAQESSPSDSRILITPYQRSVLNQLFSSKIYLKHAEKNAVANLLGVKYSKVDRWFHKKRYKEKETAIIQSILTSPGKVMVYVTFPPLLCTSQIKRQINGRTKTQGEHTCTCPTSPASMHMNNCKQFIKCILDTYKYCTVLGGESF